MTGAIVKYLPYLFLLYFVIRSLKSPVFLLGISFLIFFRYCIFFEKVKLFRVPNNLNINVLSTIWLIIFWVIFSGRPILQVGYKRVSYYIKKGFNWLDLIIIGLIAITIIDSIIVINEYLGLKDVFNEFVAMVSLFVGYFVVRDIIKYVSLFTLKDFFYSIVIINTIASLLYFIHQGLHHTLYENEEYSREIIGGEIVTRNMWVMPVLLFFSISYLVVFIKDSVLLNIIMLGINFTAVFLTYFRSFLVIGFTLILLYLLLIAYRKKDFIAIIKYFFVFAISLVGFLVIISRVLPASTNYFVSRVNQLKSNPNDEESNDLIYRFHRTGAIFDRIEDNKRVAGMGPVSETQVAWVEDVDDVTSDMVWTAVVFRWGYLGMAFFILLYLVALVQSFNLFMKGEGLLSQLGVLFFLTIVSQIFEGFISWTFMSPERFTMGLWYFGVLSALTGFNRKPEEEPEIIAEYA